MFYTFTTSQNIKSSNFKCFLVSYDGRNLNQGVTVPPLGQTQHCISTQSVIFRPHKVLSEFSTVIIRVIRPVRKLYMSEREVARSHAGKRGTLFLH